MYQPQSPSPEIYTGPEVAQYQPQSPSPEIYTGLAVSEPTQMPISEPELAVPEPTINLPEPEIVSEPIPVSSYSQQPTVDYNSRYAAPSSTPYQAPSYQATYQPSTYQATYQHSPYQATPVQAGPTLAAHSNYSQVIRSAKIQKIFFCSFIK